MKSKLIALALVLLSGSGLLATDRSSPGKRTQPPSSSLVISGYGTLLDIIDADGRSLFGTLKLDGFRVSYKTQGKIKSASAIGAKVQGLQPGQVKLEGASTSITVKTNDGKLAITSYFSFDDGAKTLTIRRSFRNISDGTLSSLVTRQYVDGKLIVSEQPGSALLILAHLAQEKITTGGDPDDCQIKECLPDQPMCFGSNCPIPGPVPVGVTTATKLGKQITLRWRRRDLTRSSVDSIVQHANEANQVIQVDLK
jgi:hypothetical protein